MFKDESTGIRSRWSFRRAPEERARLFAALELFVNLADSFEDFCSFSRQCPTFCPVLLYHEGTDHYLELLPNEASHQLALVFRDYLRLVWRRDGWALRNGVLEILLGLKRKPDQESQSDESENDESIPPTVGAAQWDETLERRSRSMFPDFAPRYRRALMLMRENPQSRLHRPYFPQIMADWERGEFCYQVSSNDFQRAVFILFRDSWRARFCRQCQKPFIADKNPQMFCGTECGASAKKDRDLNLWREQGAARRRSRNEKSKRPTK